MPSALKGDGGSGVDKTLCGVKADSMSCSCGLCQENVQINWRRMNY